MDPQEEAVGVRLQGLWGVLAGSGFSLRGREQDERWLSGEGPGPATGRSPEEPSLALAPRGKGGETSE